MRPALVSLSFVFAACSTSNPWFLVDDRPDGDSSSGPGSSGTSATSSTLTEGTGTAPTTGSPATSTTGPDPTTDATSVTSITDASSSTQSVEPSTSDSSGAGDTSTSSSGGETTAADSSTGETSDSTTGDPVIEPYYSLYALCPDKETEWYGGAKADEPLACIDPMMVPAAFQKPKVKVFNNLELFGALELAPNLEPGGAVVGIFGPFTLTPEQQSDAELFTALACASSEIVGSCAVNASMWIDYKGQQLMLLTKPVKNAELSNMLIKLWQIPGINAGDPFEVSLRADFGDVADPQDRVWFINPRIRPGP